MRLAPFAALLALTAAAPATAPWAQTPAPAPTPRLGFPLACEIGRTCEIQHYVDRDPGPGVLDYRCGRRTYDKHDGIDIRLLDMTAEQGDIEQGTMPLPVKGEPETLKVEGEIEGGVAESPPMPPRKRQRGQAEDRGKEEQRITGRRFGR